MSEGANIKNMKFNTPTTTTGGPRAAVSLTDLSTPIVDNLLSMLPSGHDKPLKHAFYNVLAFVLSALVIVAFWGVFCILDPFLKPLLWALLCGSVLHPFNERLCRFIRSWLTNVKNSPTPFTIHAATFPLKMADSFSEQVGMSVWKFWKYIVGGITAFFATYFIYYKSPVSFGMFVSFVIDSVFGIGFRFLGLITGSVVIALNAVYTAVIVQHFITKRTMPINESEETSQIDGLSQTLSLMEGYQKPIKIFSLIVWGSTFIYICGLLPYPLLVVVLIFIIGGTINYLRGDDLQSNQLMKIKSSLPKFATLVKSIGKAKAWSRRSSAADTALGTGSDPIKQKAHANQFFRSVSENLIKQKLEKKLSEDVVDEGQKSKGLISRSSTSSFDNDKEDSTNNEHNFTLDSNAFLYGVFCACLLVQIWNNLWLLHLIPIPVAYFALKKGASRFGIMSFIKTNFIIPFQKFYAEEDGPSRIIFPKALRVFFRILYNADKKFVAICEGYIAPVASIFILIIVVMALILGIIFAASQVYAEGDHVVRVGVNLVNSTVSKHPEINELLPEGWQSIMGSMVDNAYVYGREYIAKMIRETVAQESPDKAEQIEKQVTELWDKMYLAFNKTWDNAFDSSKLQTSPNGIEWNELFETGKSVPHLLDYSALANYAKANFGTLMALLDSVWKIFVGNLSLAASAVTSLLSVLLGGGTAILNLIINFVVFFTALFYLLSSSSSVYKPIELFQTWVPAGGSQSSKFITALEDAINGVFVASCKMAIFYGMWTWLIHTLFQVNIVFLPSIMAALFGAVPLLMPYWAAFPAVLELWLIQGQWTKALLMLLAQMAPMSAVDTQIYSEIKGGGHPYLTGLAVAGGIFYFGVQGAIMGPMILCCVFVAINVGSSFLKEGGTTAESE